MIRMLGKKKVATRIFWVLAVLIIPSFVLWGVGEGLRSGRRNIVAQVNRETITRREYQRHLQNLLEQRRRFADEPLEAGSPEFAALEERALEELIEQKLLFQQARRRGIRVGDEEIIARVRQDPAFRDDEGVFDQQRFDEMVRFVPEDQWLEYEEEVRRSLILRRLHEEVTGAADTGVTDEALAAAREEFGFSEDVSDEIVGQFAAYQAQQQAYEDWLAAVRERARIRIFDTD